MASYFKVMQDGREVEFSFYLNNLVVRVPYTNGYFSLVGETSNSIGSVTIVSTKEGVDIPYTVSISDSWLTSETGKIVLSENTGEERRGTVTITQSESNEDIVITFIQEAKPADNYTFVFVSDDTVDSPASGMSFNVYIESYSGDTQDNTVGATHTSLPDWITGWESVDMGTGYVAFTGQTVANDTYQDRTAVITFTQNESGKILRFTITQKAKQELKVPMSWDINFTNDSTTQTTSRFYLTLRNGLNSINAFSLLRGQMGSGITEREQGSYTSGTEKAFTATSCTILSTSGKRDLYSIYFNGTLVIQTTIQGDGNEHTVSLRSRIPVTGLEMKWTGQVTYMD